MVGTIWLPFTVLRLFYWVFPTHTSGSWNDMITVYGIETLLYTLFCNTSIKLERYDYRLRYWDVCAPDRYVVQYGWNDMITVYGIETFSYCSSTYTDLRLERYDYRLRYWDQYMRLLEPPGLVLERYDYRLRYWDTKSPSLMVSYTLRLERYDYRLRYWDPSRCGF